MEYKPENVLQRYENLLRKNSLHIGRKQWGLLEKTLNEFNLSEDPKESSSRQVPIDLKLLESLPEATSEGLPTRVIKRLQDYIIDKNGYRDTRSTDLINREYHRTPSNEVALEFYQGCCSSKDTSQCMNVGKKTIKLLRAYLKKIGSVTE